MNKDKKVIIGLVIIIIVLLVGWGAYYMGKNSKEEVKLPVTENNLPQENQVAHNTNTTNQTSDWVSTNTNGWIVKYNSEWTATPQYYGSPAEEAQGKKEMVGYQFIFPDGSVIDYGGPQSSCTQSELGVFKYGVSTQACVSGVRADLVLQNVRNVLPQADMNSFGDFVLKNS